MEKILSRAVGIAHIRQTQEVNFCALSTQFDFS